MSLIRRTPASVAGPFTGKHVHGAAPVLPPEWDMSTNEYRAALRNATKPTHRRPLLYASVAGVASGGAIYPLVLADGAATEWAPTIIVVGVFVHVSAAMVGVDRGIDYVHWKRHDKGVLARKDPALVIDVSNLPHNVCEILLVLTDVAVGASDRPKRLRLAYESAQTLTAACQASGDWTLSTLIETCPNEMDALVRYGLSAGNKWFAEPAARLQAAMTAFRVEPVADGDAVRQEKQGPRLAAAHATNQTGGASLRTRWDDAITSHDRVVEAWTDIICDPLIALEHSTLLDVTQTRTATFIETYGHAQDLRALHGKTFPVGDDMAAKEYLSAVRKAAEAWVEAVRHSEHIGFDWLPETEAANARKAAALLATANDESATTAERATAANMASERLSKVKSFLLPALALHELETRKRLELATPAALSA